MAVDRAGRDMRAVEQDLQAHDERVRRLTAHGSFRAFVGRRGGRVGSVLAGGFLPGRRARVLPLGLEPRLRLAPLPPAFEIGRIDRLLGQLRGRGRGRLLSRGLRREGLACADEADEQGQGRNPHLTLSAAAPTSTREAGETLRPAAPT